MRAALKLPAAQAGGWRVAKREEVIPTWPVRGLPEECDGDTGESTMHAEVIERRLIQACICRAGRWHDPCLPGW